MTRSLTALSLIVAALSLVACSARDVVDRPMYDTPDQAIDGPDGSSVSVVSQKTAAPMTLLARSERTDFAGVDAVLRRSLPALSRAAEQNNLQLAGPTVLIYRGTTPEARDFDLTVGLPLQTDSRRLAGKNIVKTSRFPCASAHFTGPVEHIEIAYRHIIQWMKSKGLRPSRQVREIYHEYYTPDSTGNVIEVQVGIAD